MRTARHKPRCMDPYGDAAMLRQKALGQVNSNDGPIGYGEIGTPGLAPAGTKAAPVQVIKGGSRRR